MRDINRISRVMNKLQTIWEAHPDIRFNQLLDSIQRSYSNEEEKSAKIYYDTINYHGHTTYTPIAVVDLFNLEDDKFEVYLDKLIERINK